MKRLMLVFLLMTVSLLGASFDCSKAKSDVEKMICVDVALIKADDTLNHLFKMLKTSDRLSADVIQRHKEWLNNRNLCKDLNCLYGSYNRQLEYLESKIEYQFVTDQKESCSQFVEIFNNHLDVIRYGNFSQSTKEYDGLQWLDA